ncbi:MAG: hypothetical protein R3185_01785 [Candidatus Thermoplasmatota archaeon]|nr:hypothetical protein [Candidatus Thermoplasmatota archaeon]
MASMQDSKLPSTPAIGIVLILLGVLLVVGALDLDTLLGIGAIVIGALILIGEFS